MKPKSRKEILDICQNNFWNYTTLSKVLIVISILLSAAAMATYLWYCVLPIVSGIINGIIVGWDIFWKICIIYLLYEALKLVNLVFVCIGGSAMCREEEWDSRDFAKAWMNMYKYDWYNDDEIFKK